MSSTATRISVVGGCLAAGFAVVLLHLWFLMVQENDVWARRSRENRWAFRSVPSQRGALRDRHGRLLCRDEPTCKVSIYYLRFRLRHVVGAAVEGARVWTSVRDDGVATAYGYLPGAVDPGAAARDLLGMPVVALKKGVLPKAVAAQLWTYVTTVLSGCSGLSRSETFGALRNAAEQGLPIGVGDALELSRGELLRRFDERVEELHSLAARLDDALVRRAERLGFELEAKAGLIEELEYLRVASLERKRVVWRGDDGELRYGSPLEEVRRTFVEEVPFEVAAALQVDDDRYQGIEVESSVKRVFEEGPQTSLRVLLGWVTTYDRTRSAEVAPAADAESGGGGEPADDPRFLDYVAQELPADWLETLVPAGIVDGEEAHHRLQRRALQRYESELMRRERLGVTGLEAAFDGELSGRLGMRFVEHDSKRREHLLWSHLGVEAGEDVQVTLDRDLQHVAEQAVRRAHRKNDTYDDEENSSKVEAAIAVIDALTGDVLAYAGAPIVSGNARDLPGVVWQGNGAIGSTAKPFVLVEHLAAERLGLPHRAPATLLPCELHMRYGDRILDCDETHGSLGRDPVWALAKSCNIFFYQVGIGLQTEGLRRAYRRFGLLEPSGEHDPFTICWQPRVAGLSAARPRMDENAGTPLPLRSIGYAVQASPLSVARAYAALATGVLPELGLRLGEQRRLVALGELGGALDVARRGLRECTRSGTARRLELLDDLGVSGKTGTAEVSDAHGNNNAWFSGFLPCAGRSGAQLCFCAVVYWVRDKTHGGEAAGELVVDFLQHVQADPSLRARYLEPADAGGGR